MKLNLSQIYTRYFQSLVSGLRQRYGNGPPDPNDIAQQAFEKLCALNGKQTIDKPESFLWICARNLLMSEKRAERTRTTHSEEVESHYYHCEFSSQEPERIYLAEQHLAIVQKTLSDMPTRRRELFLLNRVHGYTPEKAGAALGVSRSSAVRHIGIATQTIAEALAHHQHSSAKRTSHDA